MENLLSIPMIGNQLRQKREEQQLTIHDIANQLNIHKDLVTDLEQGNFNNISMIYFKLHLRSYAKLLAFPDWERMVVVGETYTAKGLEGWKNFKIKRQISAGDKLIQWITYSIISILVLLVVLWGRSDKLLYKSLSTNETMPDQVYQMAQNNIIYGER